MKDHCLPDLTALPTASSASSLISATMMQNIFDILLFIVMVPVYLVESLVNILIPKSWKAKDVTGEIVLVTGAGNGIGREVAVRFAKLGCSVVLWDIDEKGIYTTAKMIKENGGKAYPYTCDLSKREEIYKVAELTKQEVGIVTILINNAGIVTGKKLLEAPDDMIQRTFDVNTLSHFWTAKAFLPDMVKKSKGHIVNVASILGHKGFTRLTDYCASKFATIGFTECLHMEMIEQGYDSFINTTVVCPNYVLTGMFTGLKRTRLFPPVTPEYTGDCIIAGILANDLIVYIPRYMGMVMFFVRTLPWKMTFHAFDLCGDLNNFMKTFKGRTKDN